MKRIPIYHRSRIINWCTVDDQDYESLSVHRWHLEAGYAIRRVGTAPACHRILMHRQLLNLDANDVLHVGDHINGNRLDNRRSNLRRATRQENNRNVAKRHNNKSGYKGARLYRGAYMSEITCAGQNVYIGRFKTPAEAAWMYDQWASELFGEFANLNFDYA